MKLTFTPKDGGGFSVEYDPPPPMPEERFRALCGIVYALIIAAAFIGFFALFTGAVG